jgi:hypothetical protein
MKYLPLIMAFSVPLVSQEVNLNEWNKDYEKAAVGAREDIQYSIYRKIGESGKVYLEFQNRKNKDVKVSFKIVGKGMDRGTPIQMTGFIKAHGIWPNGFERGVKCMQKEPVIEIQEVITGVVEEEQVIEMDSDGKQIEKYKYKFKSDADIVKEKR